MYIDYLDFYQKITNENITQKTIKFLDDYYHEDVEDQEKKQKVLNEFSTRSAINHAVQDFPKEKKEEFLAESVELLQKNLVDLQLVKVKILFIVAKNSDLENLDDIDKEISDIKNGLNTKQNKSIVEIEIETHGTLEKLISHIISFKPNILHFAGHGEEEGILLTSEYNDSRLLSNSDFSKLMEISGKQLYLIFLNSCRSEKLAQAISSERKDINIISYKSEIDTTEANEFSIRFYSELSKNLFVRKSLDLLTLKVTQPNNPHEQLSIHDLVVFTKAKEEKIIVQEEITKNGKWKEFFQKIKKTFSIN